MSEKPSYLGLLNAIAQAEARGHALFSAWARTTNDAELARLLDMVAIREWEHAAAFTKRLCELGYAVQERPDPQFAARLQRLQSDCSDRAKFEQVFGYPKEDADPALGALFDDTSIDPATGALLGRFIAEERDTVRRLQAAYKALPDSADETTTDLAQIVARLERLTRTIDELKAHQRGL
jgi:rubrerythrin